MTDIFTCESNLNPSAIGDTALQYEQNGTTYGASYGIAQIRYLPGRPDPQWLLDPVHNLTYAKQLYDAHNVQPWTCAKKLGVYNPSKIIGFEK